MAENNISLIDSIWGVALNLIPLNPRNILRRARINRPPPSIIHTVRREYKLLLELRHIIRNLTSDPTLINQYKSVLVGKLMDFKYDKRVLSVVIDVLFDYSVNLPNLRCNGALLFFHLSHKIGDKSDAIFQKLLLAKCQQDFEKCEEMLRTDSTQFYGLVQLFAELLVVSDRCKSMSTFFAKAVCYFIRVLLKSPNDDNLKCVGDVLKFTGAVMKDKFESETDNYFDAVLGKLEYVLGSNESSNIEMQHREYLLGVLEMAKCNWGRGITQANANN